MEEKNSTTPEKTVLGVYTSKLLERRWLSKKASEYLAKRLTPSDYDFYLCGEREMIRNVTLLVDERFPGSLLYREVFY